MILAVDTSLGSAVAVVDLDGAVRAEASSANRLGHAEVIGDLIAQVLADAGSPRITHVAAGMGPGPFTGLRIGIAAARAFALARQAALVPVVSHDAIAEQLLVEGVADVPFGVATDARRRELAWTSYTPARDADGLPVRRTEPALVAAAEAERTFAAQGLGAVQPCVVLSAAALGAVAARAIAAGRSVGPAVPLYLRSPDVAAARMVP